MSGIGIHPETNAIRVEETHLERWNAFMEKHRRYAHMLVKKRLPNIEDLDRLFTRKTANGERGFSTAMPRNKRVTDLFGGGEGERIGVDDEDEGEDEYEVERSFYSNSDNLDGKGMELIKLWKNKKKSPTIDSVLEFLSKIVASPNVSKTERVSFTLREMGVSKDQGDRYFVDAMRYLGEGNNGDIFLALENDTQKWIFLEDGIAPCETNYNPMFLDEYICY
ncbi:hypothetical protein OROHE_025770 [Orobanche hederae]